MTKKILIDDAILEKAFAALDYALSKTSDAKEKLKFFTPMIDIQKATIASNSMRFSVIEWHGMDEVPNKFNWVITKDMNGFISSDYVVYGDNNDWHLERTEKSCLTAWAYLPNDFVNQ